MKGLRQETPSDHFLPGAKEVAKRQGEFGNPGDKLDGRRAW